MKEFIDSNLKKSNLFGKDNKTIEIGLEQYKVTDIILDFLLASKDKLKDNVVKGGISLVLHETDTDKIPARPTTDIDFHFYDERDWIDYSSNCIEVANKNSNLGITYMMEKEPKVTENGGRLYIIATKVQSVKFHIDMNYGVSVITDSIKGVNTYSVSTMLTDKLSVVCSSKIRRRIKDLYDLYLLSSNNKFYLSDLVDNITDRLNSKNIYITSIWYLEKPENMVEVKQAYNKFVSPVDIEFSTLIDKVTNFILLLVNIISKKEEINVDRYWNGKEWVI